MHIAFLSNPASGQVNVLFATAQQLVDQGHLVTFLSAASCSSKIDRFRSAQQPCHQHLIRFISVGSGNAVRDLYVTSISLLASILTLQHRDHPDSHAPRTQGAWRPGQPADLQ